jgi:hypothetical protein
MKDEFKTMKEIGVRFGLSSHKIGKALKDMDLRTPNGRPSLRAFQESLVAQKLAPNGVNYIWIWHERRIVALLVEAGMTTQ